MELNELKAKAYDLFVRLQNTQEELNKVNQLIAEQERLAASVSNEPEQPDQQRVN